MSNVLIVYGSTTGNTAALAEMIGEQLKAAGHKIEVQDAAGVSPDNLCAGRDAVLFGCSAWGTDEVELQPDFEPLFDNFDRIGVKGHKFACFATGDSNFEYFCGAVDVMEDRLNELGGNQMVEGLKVDGDAESSRSEVEEWTQSVTDKLRKD